jgi:peptidoglycan LD-endopeptidase LytH
LALGPRARVTLLAALVFVSLAALIAYLSYGYWTRPAQPLDLPPPGLEALPTALVTPTPVTQSPEQSPTPAQSPSPLATPADPQSQAAPADSSTAAPSQSVRLVMPVAGVRPEQLTDTFTQSRSEGRSHNAIDIVAPRGTPVRAAVDGPVVKLFRSDRGGITLYQRGPDNRTIYYYAHLDGYADGIAEGRHLRRGETIGFVGDTGNAQPGNYHLHFQIYVPTDSKNIWDGTPVNPYPLLLSAEP